jgi:hypothetical protein
LDPVYVFYNNEIHINKEEQRRLHDGMNGASNLHPQILACLYICIDDTTQEKLR